MADEAKDNTPITKGDLKETLDQAVDAILHGMEQITKTLDGKITEVKDEVTAAKQELKEVKLEMREMKDDIQGLKAELSDTPTRREFEELKAKVNKQIPLS